MTMKFPMTMTMTLIKRGIPIPRFFIAKKGKKRGLKPKKQVTRDARNDIIH